ncbi:MAG: response regulator [Bdellovibrionaceae bacterium]|nr:response regulator [Bdellovibrio sp.]
MNFDWTCLQILIVDDDPDLREVLSDIFRRMGCQVFSAADGAQAFNLILKNKFSIIISDLQMPVMDGRKLLEKILAAKINVPFIFITAQAHFSATQARSLGARGLIHKPYRLKSLLELIKNAISNETSATQNLKFLSLN